VRGAAAALTAEPLPPARALAEGNAPLNAALLAALFRAAPGLGAPGLGPGLGPGPPAPLAAWLEEYALEDSREERVFRVWLQSLLRDAVALRSLAEALRDGAPAAPSAACFSCAGVWSKLIVMGLHKPCRCA
jgi:hypothetical protein